MRMYNSTYFVLWRCQFFCLSLCENKLQSFTVFLKYSEGTKYDSWRQHGSSDYGHTSSSKRKRRFTFFPFVPLLSFQSETHFLPWCKYQNKLSPSCQSATNVTANSSSVSARVALMPTVTMIKKRKKQKWNRQLYHDIKTTWIPNRIKSLSLSLPPSPPSLSLSLLLCPSLDSASLSLSAPPLYRLFLWMFSHLTP